MEIQESLDLAALLHCPINCKGEKSYLSGKKREIDDQSSGHAHDFKMPSLLSLHDLSLAYVI